MEITAAIIAGIFSLLVCIFGSSIQILIMFAMLVLHIGDAEIVIPINLGIAAAFGAMVALYKRKERKQIA